MKAVNGGLHHQAQIILASILRLTARLVKISNDFRPAAVAFFRILAITLVLLTSFAKQA